MTTFPYPKGEELDNLLEPRAPGLSYLWPLAVAAGLVPVGSKPSDAFKLVKTWDRTRDEAATEAMAEVYATATVWAWVDRTRAELAVANAKKAAEVTGADTNSQARYAYWAGTQYAPPFNSVRSDPSDEHSRLWHDFARREKLLAGMLEALCVRAVANRQQTAGASDAKVRRAKSTENFIRDMARQTPGGRKHVARLIEKSLAEQDEKEFNRLSLSTILNTFSKLFRGAAWEQRS